MYYETETKIYIDPDKFSVNPDKLWDIFEEIKRKNKEVVKIKGISKFDNLFKLEGHIPRLPVDLELFIIGCEILNVKVPEGLLNFKAALLDLDRNIKEEIKQQSIGFNFEPESMTYKIDSQFSFLKNFIRKKNGWDTYQISRKKAVEVFKYYFDCKKADYELVLPPELVRWERNVIISLNNKKVSIGCQKVDFVQVEAIALHEGWISPSGELMI